MIVVLSLNTALDRVLEVPGFKVGRVYRAASSHVFAGGKGLNVARVVRQLGAPVRVVGFLGGSPTSFIRQHCDALGIEQRWVPTDGDARTCVIVVDRESDHQTVLNEPGPAVTAESTAQLLRLVEASSGEGDTLCISGSAPPGVPDSVYAEIVRSAHSRGVRLLIDATGAALRAGLSAHPWAATPNEDECRAALGAGSPLTLAGKLAEATHHAILTLGPEGALYAEGERVWHLRPPEVAAVNAVGSGDALVAGFLVGVERGLSGLDALRLGVACGASNAGRLEPGIESAESVEHLREFVAVLAPGEEGGGPGDDHFSRPAGGTIQR